MSALHIVVSVDQQTLPVYPAGLLMEPYVRLLAAEINKRLLTPNAIATQTTDLTDNKGGIHTGPPDQRAGD